MKVKHILMSRDQSVSRRYYLLVHNMEIIMQPNEFPLKTHMTVDVEIPESNSMPTITTFNLPFENVVHVNLDTLLINYPTNYKLNKYLRSLPKVLILKDNKPLVAFITLEDNHKVLEARLVLNFINNTQLIFDAEGQEHSTLLEHLGIIKVRGEASEDTTK